MIAKKFRSKTLPSAGASRLSQSLTKGAEATGSLIHKGAAKIRDRITPEETPSEVSPQVAKRLQAAKQATGGAVRVSQFLGEASLHPFFSKKFTLICKSFTALMFMFYHLSL